MSLSPLCTVTFVLTGPSMSFPITAFSGGLTLSMRMSRASAPRLICAANRMLMMISAESRMIFFICCRRNSACALFFQSAFRTPQSALFQNLPGLSRPQEQVQMVHVDAELLGELLQLFLDRKVPRARRGTHPRADHAHLAEAVQDVF